MKREGLIKQMAEEKRPWDLLIIGGGATGLGVAVDASVGIAVGASVGASVGKAVGISVGASVGIAVGAGPTGTDWLSRPSSTPTPTIISTSSAAMPISSRF